jgi:WD40 repeat protein
VIELLQNDGSGHSYSESCRALGVSRSGLYAQRSKARRPRRLEDQQLKQQISELFSQSRGTYGSRRLQHMLICQGQRVGTVNCSETPASLAWNPSGQELACGGMTGELSFWNPKNGELIDRVSATRSTILQLIYSADGSYLLSASTDNNIRLWDLASRSPACRLLNWGYIPAMRLSESGTQLAAASAGNSVSVVDLNLKPVWHTLKEGGGGLCKLARLQPGWFAACSCFGWDETL